MRSFASSLACVLAERLLASRSAVRQRADPVDLVREIGRAVDPDARTDPADSRGQLVLDRIVRHAPCSRVTGKVRLQW